MRFRQLGPTKKKTPAANAVHEPDPLLRALIRRSASSHRRRPSAATSSRFGLHPCSCSCRPSFCAAARAAAFNCRFRSLPPGRRSSFSSIAFAARTNRASSSRQIGQIMNALRRLSRTYRKRVQEGCRERSTERNRRRIRSVQDTSRLCPTTTLPAGEHESRRLTNPHPLAKIVIELMAPR